MEIIKHILYDSKVIFFSKNVNLLTNIILGFLSLILPMKYPFQVTSCLPIENYSILESISPYLFGIKENYSDDFFINKGLETSNITVLCVDLDCNNKNDPQKMHLIAQPDDEFPPLPKKLTEKLKYYEDDYKNIEKIKSNYDALINEKEHLRAALFEKEKLTAELQKEFLNLNLVFFFFTIFFEYLVIKYK